jgi:hypothetical protein
MQTAENMLDELLPIVRGFCRNQEHTAAKRCARRRHGEILYFRKKFGLV